MTSVKIDSALPERLRTTIRLRHCTSYPNPPIEAAANAAVRFTKERRRRCKAEKLVRSNDLELQVARQIQQRLFPAAAPVVPGFEIAGMTCPAEATGGDYFDYVPMMNEGVGLVVADVSGHGFGPALLMASTRAYLRAFAQTHSDLGELVTLVNRVLVLDMEDSRFVTLVLARLDPRARSLVYVSAGHPPGYVLDAAGQVRLCLASTGLPLGIEETSFTASTAIPLQVGETVVLLSDGVTEAAAPDGAAFGSARAVDVVRTYRRQPAARIVAKLYQAVCAFTQGAPQLDDITALVIKIKKGALKS